MSLTHSSIDASSSGLPRESSRKNELREKLKHVAIYGAILMCSGIALTVGNLLEHQLSPESGVHGGYAKLTAELFTELGIAGVIACFLAFTIERFSAKEFAKVAEQERQRVAQDVFTAMLGHSVPKAIKDEMSTQILAEPLIREKLQMTYRLKPLEDPRQSSYVLVDFTMTYDIRNLSSCSRPFRLKCGFSKPPAPELLSHAKFLEIEATGFGDNESLTLTGDEIATYPKQGSHVSLSYPKPLWISPDRPTKISIHSQTVKHRAGASSYFTVEYHTTSLVLTVELCDIELDVDAGASPVSRDYDWLKVLGQEEDDEWLRLKARHQTEGYYQWWAQRPLLAFQAVWVTWNPPDQVNLRN